MILADDMKVQLENQNGFCMNVKVGFSWTTLFFAFLPAVFRKDFKWAGLQVLAAGFSMGFSCLIFPFIYNRLYIKDLLQKGYLPVTPDAENVLTGKKMIPLSTTGVASNLEPVTAMRRDMYEISYQMDDKIVKTHMNASEWVAHVLGHWDMIGMLSIGMKVLCMDFMPMVPHKNWWICLHLKMVVRKP